MGRITRRIAGAHIFGLACLSLVLATASFAQAPDPKEEAAKLQPGAYYWTGMAWHALEPLEWSANGIKKIGKSSVWIYKHPQARVQLKEATPLFCYRLPETAPGSATQPPPLNLVIARLEARKIVANLKSDPGKARSLSALVPPNKVRLRSPLRVLPLTFSWCLRRNRSRRVST